MGRTAAFRDMKTAPKAPGVVIEVRHGLNQEIVRAEWAGQTEAWIRADDPHRKTLHRVTGWRPVE
jgi:hypothetical protein